MQLFTSQQLRQKQSLVVTAQLQQAIRLLQMTNLELHEFLDAQSEENPFLEVTPGEADAPVSRAEPATAEKGPEAVDAGMRAGDLPEDGPVGEDAFANSFETGQLDLAQSTRLRDAGGEAFDDMAGGLAMPQPSLYAHVTARIEAIFADPSDRMIALALADALEPSGWLGRDLNEIAQSLRADPAAVEAVLLRLQREIEPAGLFARTLAECLRLQSVDRGMESDAFCALLDNLALLAAGNMKMLARLCGVDGEGLKALLRQLRSLDPKPGARFDAAPESISPPDLVVRATPAGWVVDLNRSTLPSVRVDRALAERILKSPSGVKTAADARAFARDRIAEAGWLRRAIAQRNATTLKIGVEIVRQQQAFLEKGHAFLRPLVLRDVAEAVGVHESTVSRVTSGLMMATPVGTFRLKAFFSVGLGSTGEEGSESAAAVKFRIRKLIESEPADAPYSDDALVRMIAADGIRLARRTAAKYREMLDIPSSFERRRKAVMAGQI